MGWILPNITSRVLQNLMEEGVVVCEKKQTNKKKKQPMYNKVKFNKML